MKADEFRRICAETPLIIAVFALTKVPSWTPPGRLAVGDEMFVDQRGYLVHMNTLSGFSLGPSYLKFIEYRSVTDRRIIWRY